MNFLHSLLPLCATAVLMSACAQSPVSAPSARTATAPGIQLWPIVRSSDPAGTLDAMLAQPSTDGIVYYIGVARVMPAEGVFDWSPVDAVLAGCQAAGKPVKLALLGGRWVPEWFYAKGAQRFSWNLSTPYVDAGTSDASACVPWDPVYLAAMESAVSAAARRYGDNPALAAVQITGPALANGLEMNLNISKQQAERIGYTPEKLADAWVRMARHYAAVFPKQKLSLALHNLIAGGRDSSVSQRVLAEVQPLCGDRLGVLVCYATYEPWFDRGNPAVDLWLDTEPATRHEAQLIDLFSAKNTPPTQVAEAVVRARRLGAESLEVFSADLRQEPYRIAIDAARHEQPSAATTSN